MSNVKSPGHDGLTKNFIKSIDLEVYFINSLKQSKIDGSFPTSQRRAITKILAEKVRTKDLSKTGPPISLLMLTQTYY